MQVPYVDIAGQFAQDKAQLMPMIEAILMKGMHVNAPEVSELEEKLAKFHNVDHAICLNSGTDALVFALRALGVSTGDEVITQANSFIASAAAIVQLGAVPVFVDVLPDQSICPDLMEKAITNKTKAIMPVHLTGHMGQMEDIRKIAVDRGIPIVEDAAQAMS